MSFDSGGVGVRFLAGNLDTESVLSIAEQDRIQNVDDVVDPAFGWAGPRHLMDGDLSSENCVDREILRLNLVKAERKFPAGRFKAEVKREMLAWMKSEGRSYVNRQTRGELKQQVKERLLPEAPVGLDGIEFIHYSPRCVSYTDALNDSKLDALLVRLNRGKTFLRAINPDWAAREAGVNPYDFQPLPFSADRSRQQEMFTFTIGREFLTWLLWTAETAQEIALDGDDVAVLVDGPVVMADCSDKVQTVNIKGEAPTVSEEFQQALSTGKLLKRARVTFCCGDDLYTTDVDADEWVFRGLKLPFGEALEAQDRFVERLVNIDRFRRWWMAAFSLFLTLRVNAADKMHDACFEWAFQRPVAVRMRAK